VGLEDVMLRILDIAEGWRAEEALSGMGVLYNRPKTGTTYRPAFLRLLPLDTERLVRLGGHAPGQEDKPPARAGEEAAVSRSIPDFTMPWKELFSYVLRQHLYISIYMALVESLAAENGSRLASMQAAEKNVEDHLNELYGRYHRIRQAAITTELLDIVTGYEALRSGR
jgi:F-type H+-transporting ATPase subunit gamma